jgi:hypothetical protein
MFANKFRFFLLLSGVILLAVLFIFLKNKNSAAGKNREEIVLILNDIKTNAQTHYKRTNSFTGWTIPASLRTKNVGTFHEKVEKDKVTIYAVGKVVGEDGKSNVNIQLVMTGNNAEIKIRN